MKITTANENIQRDYYTRSIAKKSKELAQLRASGGRGDRVLTVLLALKFAQTKLREIESSRG